MNTKRFKINKEKDINGGDIIINIVFEIETVVSRER